MPVNKIFEIFSLGAYVMYFMYTAAFLLKYPSNRHCKVVGYAMLLWGAMGLLSIHPFISEQPSDMYDKITYIIFLCDVPSGWMILFTISYRTKMTWKKALPSYMPIIALAVLQYVLPDTNWKLIASCYVFVYSVMLLLPFWTHTVRYRKYIYNHYSNHEFIHLAWLWQWFALFALILAAWYISTLTDITETMTLYYVVSTIAWMIMVHRITHQQNLIEERIGEDVTQKIVNETKEIRHFKHEGAYEFEDELTNICQNRVYFTRPDFTLNELASILHTTPALLTHYFCNKMETTFYDFINIQRISMASMMLQTGSTNLDEIAKQSGFASTATFRRIYKLDFGYDPEKDIQK